MFGGYLTVIRQMQHGDPAKKHEHKLQIEAYSRPSLTPAEVQEKKTKLRTDLPRHEGMLMEKHRNLLGQQSEKLRWVILDPREATLSIWDRPPAEAGCVFGGKGAPGKAPRKVFSMDKLSGVDSNKTYRSLFISFEGGDSVSLSADREEDFRRWLQAVADYSDVSRSTAPKLGLEHFVSLGAKLEAIHEFASAQPERQFSSHPDEHGGKFEFKVQGRSLEIAVHPSPPQKPQKDPGSTLPGAKQPVFDSLYRKIYQAEPNPEPGPGFNDLYNQNLRKGHLDEYDTGAVEHKAITPSMGIMDNSPLGLYAPLFSLQAAVR